MDASRFRPIYYLGCKATIAPAIRAAIDEVDPSRGRLCDLFAGTGAVASALGTTREVTTVDVQEYSRVLCSATLSPPTLSQGDIDRISKEVKRSNIGAQIASSIRPLIEYENACIQQAASGDPVALADLLEALPLAVYSENAGRVTCTRLTDIMGETHRRLREAALDTSPDTTVSRYFGGVYFSFEQAAILDAILAVAETSDEPLRDAIKAAALSTASILVNTVGKQFAQPLRPRNKSGAIKASLAKIVQRDRSLDTLAVFEKWLAKFACLPKAIGRPQTIRDDYKSALNNQNVSYSVIYADPPYTRDHYSRFYHVLETMCLRDNPTVSRVTKNGKSTISRGVYREERHQSPFCIRSSAPDAFSKLFESAKQKGLPLVLSYSPHESGDGTHPRVVSTSQIVDMARRYYDRVQVTIIEGSTHNQLNRYDLRLKARDNAEIIVKCYR